MTPPPERGRRAWPAIGPARAPSARDDCPTVARPDDPCPHHGVVAWTGGEHAPPVDASNPEPRTRRTAPRLRRRSLPVRTLNVVPPLGPVRSSSDSEPPASVASGLDHAPDLVHAREEEPCRSWGVRREHPGGRGRAGGSPRGDGPAHGPPSGREPGD